MPLRFFDANPSNQPHFVFQPNSQDQTSPFSPARQIAQLLGVRDPSSLTSREREALEQRTAGHLEEFLALSQETDPSNFSEDLMNLGVRLEQDDRLEMASAVFSHLDTPQAEQRLNAINGVGESGSRTEFLLRRLAQQAIEPTALFGMGVAGAAFRMTRLATLGRLASTPTSNLMTRGFGARAVSSLAGFGVEATVFPAATRLGSVALGRELDWSTEALGGELAGSFLVLGGLKLAGWGSMALFNRAHGIRPGAVPLRISVPARISQPVFAQAGMLGGIFLGHQAEELAGLRPHQEGATTLADSLTMLLQFHVAGRLSHSAFGERFRQWERELDAHSEALAQRARGEQPTIQDLMFPVGAGLAPAHGHGGPGLNPPRQNFGIPTGGRTQGPPLPGIAKIPNVLMTEARGEGGGAASRRVDPEQTLAVLPTGSLTPHGNERTTHQRAVGDPQWQAEVAEINGQVRYLGNGEFADAATGEPISLEQIQQRYGEAIRAGTGFRTLASELPIETDWAGQIPRGLRGEEGRTVERLLTVMGLSKRQIRELAFRDSGSLITGMDQFALQGLYALYRSAVQWGVRLDEIVGRDPRQLSIAASAGLGGMSNLVDLITASTRRQMKDGEPLARTDPRTGPMWLPSLLIDSMQGLFVAILGPKGDALPATLARDSIIRTVGRIPVNVGACATGYKTFADAAEMFRPTWPGQIATELAFFGASEAGHGRVVARPEATGFNAMGAMETRERLTRRGGRLEDGYAPLTTDVLGFWPSEGAGVGALMRLARAIERGLPIDAAVLGYSVMGDEGGKPNPAGLGMGGLSTLHEALQMMSQWQGVEAPDLQYMSLHGTGTPNNNQVEPANLLRALDAFGYDGQLRVSAFKAFLGHGLGSAGAMEIALLMQALRRQLAPGAFNLEGRQLDPNVLALGSRILVSPEPMGGPIRVVGGQSQGFAGNNAAALFRAVNPEMLQEVYGYSTPEIEAYHRRLSERIEQSRIWEEDIRTGRKTIGEFLSWFGLGSEAPPERTIVDLGSTVPAGQSATTGSLGRSEPAEPRRWGRAAAFLRGIRVSPLEQMIVSVGPGELLTTRGTTRATRRAAMLGIDHPQTLAALAEDMGDVRYVGRDESGTEQWVRITNGLPITAAEIQLEFGPDLLRNSGIREIPLEGDSTRLPVRHGGLLPESLRTAERLLRRMELHPSQLKGSFLENQGRNLGSASDVAVYGLFAALGATAAFGRPLHELFASNRFGAAQGSAFSGLEKWVSIYERAMEGRDSVTYDLQSALLEAGRGNYLNLLLPYLEFSELEANPGALRRILPDQLGPGEMPNTGGSNLAFSAACASGLYALWGGHRALLRTGVFGEHAMDAMMVFGADATFSPYNTAPAVAGFSRRAPMTVDSLVKKLAEQNRIPEALQYRGLTSSQIWEGLPDWTRRQAMNEASAPFTRFAKGLVVAEAAAALPWVNFRTAIDRGLWPSSRLLGIHVNAGEGGTANLASMDQGFVTATLAALRMAAGHGVVPKVIQTHGTSTALNNVAEIQSLVAALRYQGYSHEFAVSAIKGLVGHSMGAASAVDMVMGVQSLLEQAAPGLFNFRSEDLDPRYAERIPEALQRFRFSSDPVQGPIEGILLTSEGFLSADAAAVLGYFPQDAEGAVELLRDYGVPEHQRSDWRVRAEENRARAEDFEERLRRREVNYRDLIEHFRFQPELASIPRPSPVDAPELAPAPELQPSEQNYGRARVLVDPAPGLAKVRQLVGRMGSADLARLGEVREPRADLPIFIAGGSDGMGLQMASALLQAGARNLVVLFYEPEPLLRRREVAPPLLARLANIEGLKCFARERNAALETIYQDFVLARSTHADGHLPLPPSVVEALERATGRSSRPDLVFVNSIAFAPSISPNPGGERRMGIPSVNPLTGQVVMMDMDPYNERNYQAVLDNMGNNHGVALQALTPYFGPDSLSFFFTWPGGSQRVSTMSGIYGGAVLGRAKVLGEQAALRYHLQSAEQNFARGHHKIVNLPSFKSLALARIPGGYLFGLAAQDVLSTRGVYLDMPQLAPRIYSEALGGQHVLENPAAAIDFASGETTYISEITQRIEELQRRISEEMPAYRERHPDWDGRAFDLPTSLRLLEGLVSEEFLTDIRSRP